MTLMKRLSVTNLSSENNLPMFQLNACSSRHQGESEEVRTNTAIYSHELLRIHVIGGQRLGRIAPYFLPPHHTQLARKIHITHKQACACTQCSISMITDGVNCVSVSIFTVHVVGGLFPLMRFALETNVPSPLSTGLSWLWGCREKRGKDGTSLSWKIPQ